MRTIALSPHAVDQITERRLQTVDVIDTVESPDEVLASGRRLIAQRLVNVRGRDFLLRVIYEERDDVAYIITVYLTSKVRKYRSQS